MSTVPRSDKLQKTLRDRLLLARFRLNHLITQAERGDHCLDLVNTSISIQELLKRFDEIVLENHLDTCFVRDVHEGREEQAEQDLEIIVEKKKVLYSS